MPDLTFNTPSGQTIGRNELVAYLNTGTSAVPVWSPLGKRVGESDTELDWESDVSRDILGNIFGTLKNPTITQSFDPYDLDGGDVAALHPLTLGLMVLGEAIMGLVLGLAVNFLFMGIQAGGELLGFQMGFTMIQFADPLTGNQTGTAAFFLWMVSLLVFLLLDGHLHMIRGFAASFALVPPGGLLITHTLLDQILTLAAQLFILALKIAVGFFFVGLLLTILSDHVASFIAGIPGLFTNLLNSMSPLFAK